MSAEKEICLREREKVSKYFMGKHYFVLKDMR